MMPVSLFIINFEECREMWKKWFRLILSMLVICSSLFFLQKLLVPKYVDDIIEGALIAEYYDEEKNHDVIFIGDCEVYENFSPPLLWERYGINSYIRGSAQQLIWQSYYLLEDTLRYEKPKIVIFNVLSMQYSEPQKEAYNRMTLDGMKWSVAKHKAVLASMTSKEKYLDYVFPILRYHARWSSLSSDDVKYLFQTKKVSHNGYYMRVDVKAADKVPEGKILGNYDFSDTVYNYLDRMTALCRENDIELILIKAPSLYPYWYEQWDKQIAEYAEENGVMYINFLELADEIGIDYSMDTYDGGLHLNLSGAEKLTDYLGNILNRDFGVPSRHGEPALEKEWAEKMQVYKNEITRQYQELLEAQ